MEAIVDGVFRGVFGLVFIGLGVALLVTVYRFVRDN